MNEVTLQWIQLLKLMILAGSAVLYGFGGVSGKWKRRFIAPFLLTGGIMGVSLWIQTFSWYYAFFALLLAGAFSIGYGENSKLMKLTKSKVLTRGIAGLAIGAAALPIALVNGAWILLCLHISFTISTSIILGVFNPTKSARAEETMIGFIAGFIPMMGMI